ncbi:MAG: putative branched-chain amino acid transporter substrate binding lipoprotein [Ilumatobacteraceae bacterium]|nr:putative branched-chain amino acid transporter substrate binding lipoprotein [Ilumatobacteraceae bacterium]
MTVRHSKSLRLAFLATATLMVAACGSSSTSKTTTAATAAATTAAGSTAAASTVASTAAAAVAGGSTTTAASAAGTAGGTAGPASGKPFIIGINADTTGPGAPYSVPAFKTVQSTVDLVNSQGGVLGRPLKLVQGNDESDATKTPAVLAQLKDKGAIFLLSQQGAATPNALIQSTGLPFMTVTGVTADAAMPPNNTYGFVIANPLTQWAPTFCASFKAANVKKVAILAEDSATIKYLNGVLLKTMNNCVEIVAQEVAPINSSDLTAPISRIKGDGADAVWVTSSGGPFEVLAFNTLAQLMPSVQKFTLASIANEPDIWKLANKGALNGVVGLGSLNDANVQTQKLREILKADRGADFVPTAFDAQAYDAVMIIKYAIEHANGDTSPQALVASMETMSAYPASFGAPGYTLSFSPTKHTAFSGECGIVMVQFDQTNTPKAWPVYQPSC